MKKSNFFTRVLVFILAVAIGIVPGISHVGTISANAQTVANSQTLGAGSIGTVVNSNDQSFVEKLPGITNQDYTRFTTDTYNSNNAAIDTNDWGSNWLWDLEGDRTSDETGGLTGTAYAFPLSFLMKKDGLRIAKPSMTSNKTNISAYYIKDVDTLGDFNIKPDWTSSMAEIDRATDWSYEGIVENPDNNSQSMRVIMTQGSPFGFVELTNSDVISLEKLRVTYPSNVVYSEIYDGCLMYVFECQDFVGTVNGYPSTKYQYYAAYFPASTSVTSLGTTDTTGNDGIGTLKFTLPNDRTYMSFAWLCESAEDIDSTALAVAQEYRPYAFNFISDTKADYSYNESTSKLTTTYTYAFDKKAESTADGTVMGILPHQYKNMSGYSYMSHQAITLRGYMKFLKGSSYTTTMEYDGILPYMPALPEEDVSGTSTLQTYVTEWMNKYMSNPGSWTLANDEVDDTYYQGKKLNRSAQVLAAAKMLGDEESAETVLNALEAELEEWFTYSGSNDSTYFTYKGDGVGVLLGFPTSFNAADQFNDHHFHYGYFIEAAACVGLWDKAWLEEYKDVVKQLVYDIASPYRNQNDCVADCGNAYPYLRSFSPYEGHSWASGYCDERTGNNQESTSEAINAWAGIILFGELIGDEEIRDLGIYLYTTEIEAANNYWFDHDGDIYKIDASNYEPPMASMVWGGKADYATWFGQKYTQGIQICPMQSWSFYLLQGGSDYIKNYYNYDKTSSIADGGSTGEWNDMWAAYYALADPLEAMNSVWTKTAINDGESQAHTYHYIQSMIDYGTPDLSFTCNNPLSAVFNKDGSYTYVVYNASSTSETVTFTAGNGATVNVVAAPNAMTVFNSEDVGKSAYAIEYYAKDLSGDGYSLISSVVKYADAGSTVTAAAKTFTGYTYESGNGNNVTSATVNADGSTTLKLYYTRNTYTVSYELNDGTKNDEALYPSAYTYGSTYTLDAPTKEGYQFMGWYLDADFAEKLDSITARTYGNMILYARWALAGTIFLNDSVYMEFDSNVNGTFYIIGDTDYKAVNVLYKICDTEEEAAFEANNKTELGYVSWGMTSNASGWEYTSSFSADEGKYIVFYFIRYDDNGGYKTSYAYGQIVGNDTSSENPPGDDNPGDDNPGDDITWTVVGNSNDQFYYGDASNISVVNVQQPGFATESGIYMTTESGAIRYIKINGVTVGIESVAIQGAGAVVYLSALTSSISTVTYYGENGNELGSIKIKNINGKEDAPATVSYTVEYYFQDTDLEGYAIDSSETINASGEENKEVSAEIKEFTGFTHDADIDGTVLSGILNAEGEPLVLKVYYKRNTYDITYELYGGTNATENVAKYVYGVGLTLADPIKDGYVFDGWYKDADFNKEITSIGTTETGVITVYAKWNVKEDGGGNEGGKTYPMPENGGYTYADGVVTFYCNEVTTGIVYVAVVADEETALAYADAANTDADWDGGFNDVPGHIGGTFIERNGRAEYDYTMAEGAYFVYALNPNWSGVQDWYVGVASATQTGGDGGGEIPDPDPQPIEVTYTVEHYQQNTDLNGYDLLETESGKGNAGDTVSATSKTYTGFTYNSGLTGTVASGTLVAGENFTLKLYYDRNSYGITYANMDGATNSSANKVQYVYGVGMILENPTKDGYTFDGWYTSADFAEDSRVTEISTQQTGNMILYAKWDETVLDEEDNEPDYDFTVDTIKDKYYTGSKIVPEIVVKDGDKVLTVKKDYTVKITNNVKAGMATVKITGKGNYSGTVEKQFEILPISIGEDNADISADNMFVAYKNGKNIKVSPKVLWGTKKLKLNKDFYIDTTVEGSQTVYTEPGIYEVVLKGKGNYKGERTIQFRVTDKVLMSKVKISSIPKQYYANGEAIEPAITVKYKGNVLKEGEEHDYTVEYLNNTSAGTATVIVTGNGTTFIGERKLTFKIVGTALKTMPFTLENTEFEYTGEEIFPDFDAGELEVDEDFTVTYSKNKNVGKGTVIFTGINGYTGTVKKTFKITPYNIGNNTENLFTDVTGDITVEYLKGGNKPSVELYFDDVLLKEGTDYTLKYTNHTKVGTGTITIKGKGQYTGKITKDFEIESNDMDNLIVMPEDIVFKAGKGAKYYMAKLTVNDVNGKKLAVGKDYTDIVYEYFVDGEPIEFDKNSAIGELPVGTVLQVTITGINNYEGTVSKEYEVVTANIKSAKFKIPTQTYTGEAITLDKSDITLTINGAPVTFEIVEDSYVNNVNKGTAKVTVRGTGNYGGYKTLTFKIGQKGVMEVITGIFSK